MELTNGIKIQVIKDRIQAVEREKYGFALDHEVQTIIGSSPEHLKKIEAHIAQCVQALRILNQKLTELEAPAVEHVNGKEPEHASMG